MHPIGEELESVTTRPQGTWGGRRPLAPGEGAGKGLIRRGPVPKGTPHNLARSRQLDAVRRARDAIAHLQRTLDVAALAARHEGATWAEVAAAAGISTQGAYKRYAR